MEFTGDGDRAAQQGAEAETIAEFRAVSGASENHARQLLKESGGDLQAALQRFFVEDDPGQTSSDAPDPQLPEPAFDAEGLVGSLLAAVPTYDSSRSIERNWGSQGGRALGSSADDPPAVAQAPRAETRENAKKLRVIFWANGFTVEDVTEEEAASTAAASAPRRTGVATLSDSRAAAPPRRPPPPLRKYEDNAQFMADLKAGIPPVEFRELDLRSGVPRPRPVDIMLVDLRPRPYPEEAAARAARADAPAPPPASTPFAGQGRTLADAAPADAAAHAAVAGADWPLAGRTQPEVRRRALFDEWGRGSHGPMGVGRACLEVDTSLPTTELQLRLAGGGTRRFRLNLTNSILDLRGLVEAELKETGAAFRPYQLLSGFPPRPLPADDATLEQANLTNAALSQRWL